MSEGGWVESGGTTEWDKPAGVETEGPGSALMEDAWRSERGVPAPSLAHFAHSSGLTAGATVR